MKSMEAHIDNVSLELCGKVTKNEKEKKNPISCCACAANSCDQIISFTLRLKWAKLGFVRGATFVFISLQFWNVNKKKKIFDDVDSIKNSNVRFARKIDSIICNLILKIGSMECIRLTWKILRGENSKFILFEVWSLNGAAWTYSCNFVFELESSVRDAQTSWETNTLVFAPNFPVDGILCTRYPSPTHRQHIFWYELRKNDQFHRIYFLIIWCVVDIFVANTIEKCNQHWNTCTLDIGIVCNVELYLTAKCWYRSTRRKATLEKIMWKYILKKENCW